EAIGSLRNPRVDVNGLILIEALRRAHVNLLGNITAPKTRDGWKDWVKTRFWIYFSSVRGLTIDGTGTLDGQGSILWDNQGKDEPCDRPTALHFHEPYIRYIKIASPGDSTNTDGIDVSASTRINIHDSNIQTGDDCVAINGGVYDINVTRVFCRPGHDIRYILGALEKTVVMRTATTQQVFVLCASGQHQQAQLRSVQEYNICRFGYDSLVSQKLDPHRLVNLNVSQTAAVMVALCKKQCCHISSLEQIWGPPILNDSQFLPSLKLALAYNDALLKGRLTSSRGSIVQSKFLGFLNKRVEELLAYSSSVKTSIHCYFRSGKWSGDGLQDDNISTLLSRTPSLVPFTGGAKKVIISAPMFVMGVNEKREYFYTSLSKHCVQNAVALPTALPLCPRLSTTSLASLRVL
ncbi:probable polygalacturonase, partial [Tanacetum coccineum]